MFYGIFLSVMGGRLFSDKTKPIRQSDVIEAQEKISLILQNIGIEFSLCVGSAGLKSPDELSGDIDIAFEKPDDFDFDKFVQTFKKMGYDTRWSKRYNIISIPLEYSGGFVQCDMLPVDNLYMAQFGLRAPAYWESSYKSALRNDIIRAVLQIQSKKVLEKTEDGKAISWEQDTMIPALGVYKQVWSRKSKRKNYLLKEPVMISQEKITDSPDEIVSRVFGEGAKPGFCLSAEDAMELLENSPIKNEAFKIAREVAKENGYKYPREWDELV